VEKRDVVDWAIFGEIETLGKVHARVLQPSSVETQTIEPIRHRHSTTWKPRT
jgi:hypothetical protein